LTFTTKSLKLINQAFNQSSSCLQSELFEKALIARRNCNKMHSGTGCMWS